MKEKRPEANEGDMFLFYSAGGGNILPRREMGRKVNNTLGH